MKKSPRNTQEYPGFKAKVLSHSADNNTSCMIFREKKLGEICNEH